MTHHDTGHITQVPLLDLTAQYAEIKEEIDDAIRRVVESQRFILGPEVEAFEREVAEYCNVRHAVGVSSGTDALLVALMALGVSGGDEVITTPFTFFATAGSILRLGARPVFSDIEPDTFNMETSRLEELVTPKTKAIMPVHLFGQCCDMDPLMDVAARFSLPVVEDAAQAIGAQYGSKIAGSIGTVGCFSFFPSKNLGGFGEGGLITTNDDSLAERIRILRNQGSDPKYYHPVVGGNFRLDALQAAILRVKLRHLDTWTEKRGVNAAYYTKRFNDVGLAGKRIIPPQIVQERHVFNQYVIRADDRDGLKRFLDENRIGTEIYYPLSVHLQECMAGMNYKVGDFPVSEEAGKSVLALPIYPELSQAHQEYVISNICRFYG